MDSDIFFVEGAELRSLKEHPFCAIVPASAGISARDGTIMEPVVLIGCATLDGRARVSEALRLEVPCPCRYFDPRNDGHPATFIVERALEQRDLTTPQRAVIAASLVHQIMRMPAWLEPFDPGGVFAKGLRTRSGRAALLKACAISSRTYQRMHGVHDPDLLSAISDERVPLRDAQAARDLGPATRRRIFALPYGEQKEAFAHAIERAHKLKAQRRSLPLPISEQTKGIGDAARQLANCRRSHRKIETFTMHFDFDATPFMHTLDNPSTSRPTTRPRTLGCDADRQGDNDEDR